MGQPAAKQGDQIVATDTHIVMVPAVPSPVPTPLPHPFTGKINGGLSGDVKIMGKPAATVDSTADNSAAARPDAARHELPEAAVEQGDDQDGQLDGEDQRQEGGAQRRHGR